MGKDTFVAPRVDKKAVPDVLGAIFADKGRPTQVAVEQIRTDGGTQMRAGLDDSTVFEYTQAMVMAQGWGEFPAVIAYHDGAAYWLADGFHRVAAFKDGFPDATKTIPVEVRAGTRRDAILHAAGANASHGLRRSNADKRRAVEVLLRDEEWAAWSDHEIARQCSVSQPFVSSVRKSLSDNRYQMPAERTVTRNGTTYTVNTANIGKTPERQYRTVTELIDEIKTCVKPHYAGSGLTRSQIAADMRKNCNSREGAFWEFVSRQTSNFRPLDLDLAMGQVAYQVETYGVDFNLNAHADRTLGGAPAVLNTPTPAEPPVITLDDLEVVASVPVPAAAPKVVYTTPTVDPDEEIVNSLDCYEENGAPAAGKMRDLRELRALLQDVRDQKTREYSKLTGQEVPAVLAVALSRMIDRLTEAMDTFQAEVEAAHVNQ